MLLPWFPWGPQASPKVCPLSLPGVPVASALTRKPSCSRCCGLEAEKKANLGPTGVLNPASIWLVLSVTVVSLISDPIYLVAGLPWYFKLRHQRGQVRLLTSGTGALNTVSLFLILDLPVLVRLPYWEVRGRHGKYVCF